MPENYSKKREQNNAKSSEIKLRVIGVKCSNDKIKKLVIGRGAEDSLPIPYSLKIKF